MSLVDTLTTDLKASMKARDKVRTGTLRMLLADLKNSRIQAGEELDEAAELAMLTRQAKRRREAFEAYDKGGRAELAEAERAELAVIETYLPQPLSEEEVQALAEAAIAEVGATSMRDMGKVMGKLMPQLKGRFDGKRVQPIVRGLLG